MECPPPRHVAHYERVLGTSMELQLVAEGDAAALAEEAALVEIDRLEAIFSAFHEGSEFSRWQRTFDEWVPVSPELAAVLAEAERLRIETGGAFDPTMASGGGPRWEVQGDRARRLTPRVASLHALAKGTIVDRAAEAAFTVDGVEEVLLNIGGDLRHRGEEGVRVAIADPFAPAENANPAAAIRIRNQGVATSGSYRRGAHLIDPRKGEAAHGVASATVAAPTTAEADALATAAFVLPPREGLRLADRIGVALLLVLPNGKRRANGHWKSLS